MKCPWILQLSLGPLLGHSWPSVALAAYPWALTLLCMDWCVWSVCSLDVYRVGGCYAVRWRGRCMDGRSVWIHHRGTQHILVGRTGTAQVCGVRFAMGGVQCVQCGVWRRVWCAMPHTADCNGVCVGLYICLAYIIFFTCGPSFARRVIPVPLCPCVPTRLWLCYALDAAIYPVFAAEYIVGYWDVWGLHTEKYDEQDEFVGYEGTC